MTLKNMPYGAIATRERVEQIINECIASGENKSLYEVNGIYPSVYEIVMTPLAYIEDDIIGGVVQTGTPYKHWCLGDRNIGMHHNINYIFEDKELAEAHMQFALENKDMIRYRENHKRMCNRFLKDWGY